jgi:hypothetical protein
MSLLAVIESRVECPWFGSIDVDACLSCARLRSLQKRDGHEFISCAHRANGMESFMMHQAHPQRLGNILHQRRT